jgi:ubiquinone/menaquinone biosynthesis C-methylase UbiE
MSWRQAMMLRQIGALRPNSTMLEVGCGTGRASIHFIRYLERGRFHCVEVRRRRSGVSRKEWLP